MYSFLPSAATRAVTFDWTRFLSGALAVVKVEPTEQVSNALAIMQSYATASPSSFISLSRGARDVKEYVALLTALDDVVNLWPLRLRQLLALPAVALVSSSNNFSGSTIRVPVRTPRGEALVFLLNVALGHLESGLGYVARLRADTATSTSVCTPQGGCVAVPNQNAKIAAQHFRQAVVVLKWANTLHALPASPSAVALQQLHNQLPLDVMQGMAVLCAAVAKYMYALSSASTKDKPDVLAKFAFEAAQLPLPTSVPSASSLQLLPSLLLAAYHYHKATWYYAHNSAKGPDMAEALGHMRYADKLLCTCNAQWSVEETHKQAEHESRQWWGGRLVSLFSGAKKNNNRQSGGNDAPASGAAQQLKLASVEGYNDEAEDVDEDNPTLLRPTTRYPRLLALLVGKTSNPSKCNDTTLIDAPLADVVQVYPYVQQLLNDVCAALQQYEHENRVVYFVKVATADEVRHNVPDVQDAAPSPAAATAEAESAIFESRASLFASLPTPNALQETLAQQEEVGQAQLALSRTLQRLEKDGRLLSTYITPTAALEQALDALEALLPNAEDRASPKGAVVVAVDAVDAAFQRLKKIAAEWQEEYDVYVGEHCPPPRAVQDAESEVLVWSERATAALEKWAALCIPASVDDRTSFVAALVPRSAEISAYLEQVDRMSRDVRDVLAAEASTVTQAQVQSAVEALEKVKQRGTGLLAAAAVEGQRQNRTSASTNTAITSNTITDSCKAKEGEEVEELCVAPQYETAEAAVLAVVDVLQGAPIVVGHIEHFASQLLEMRQRVVVTPLSCVRKVVFRDKGVKHLRNDGTIAIHVDSSDAVRAPQNSVVAVAETAKPPKRRATSLKPAAATTAVTPTVVAPSTASSTSRKRSRDNIGDGSSSSASSEADEDSDVASVNSFQLGCAEEVTPGKGVTRAAVSDSLLSCLKANKAKRLASSCNATVTTSAAVGVGATHGGRQATKTRKSRAKR